MKTFWDILKTTGSNFMEDKAMRLAAAIAFYAVFSLGPVLVIVVVVAGFVWGDQAARGELVQQVGDAVGEEAAGQIQQIIAAARDTPGGTVATIISVIMLIVAATVVFSQLRDALNTVWEVQPKPKQPLLGIVRDRALSFGVVIGIALVLVGLLFASTAIAALSGRMDLNLPLPISGLQIVEFVVSWIIISLLFAAVFKWLPDVKIRWKDVMVGAVITAFLFGLGRVGLGWYLGRGTATSVYGAAGSLVAIFLWIYYSAVIFLFGAELTQVYAKRWGQRIQPSENAMPITQEARAQQGIPGKKDEKERDEKRRARRQPERALPQASPTEQFYQEVSRSVARFIVSAVASRWTDVRKEPRDHCRVEMGERRKPDRLRSTSERVSS